MGMTVRINDELHRRLKQDASLTGRTVRDVVEAAIRAHLGDEHVESVLAPMPVFGREGALPGVEIDDARAVRGRMDEGVDIRSLR